MSETNEAAETPTKHSLKARILPSLALVQAVAVVIVVLIALPAAFTSMDAQLWERNERTLYAFPSGEPLVDNDDVIASSAYSVFNIAPVNLDEDGGSVTLAISGHRVCADACPQAFFTLFSIANDAHVRRALPPSASVTLPPDDQAFTHTVQLPIRGQPSLYPFDSYEIWLGLSGVVVVRGVETPLTEELLPQHAIITTQNQLRDFTMDPPAEIDPDLVRVETDPVGIIGVQELVFDRPAHLEILTVLLVLLVSVSAIIAVFMRQITDLVFGIGSLILAIWGVRSVLVPTPLPVVTSVDLALSIVILFVLLGLSLRATRKLHQEAGLPPMIVRLWKREEEVIRAMRRGKGE